MMRRFIESDLREINEWYSAYEMEALSYDDLPEIGYIIPKVCAGFLYKTDSNACLLDGFIASPLAFGNIRKTALNQVTDALLIDAEDLCFDKVLAFTMHDSIRSRCERYEFVRKNDYTLFVKEI